MIRMKDKHKKNVHHTLYYAPRVLAILVGLFFLTMLFDLRPEFTIWEFLKAALPGAIIIAAILLTWNKPRRASLVFAILCLVYTIIGWIFIQENVIGTITVPLIIVSALLIVNAKSHLFV